MGLMLALSIHRMVMTITPVNPTQGNPLEQYLAHSKHSFCLATIILS
jgi:hypothetical protein